MQIIGIWPCSFTDESGKLVKFHVFFLSYPLEDGEGVGVHRVFVPDEKMPRGPVLPKVGDNVSFDFLFPGENFALLGGDFGCR